MHDTGAARPRPTIVVTVAAPSVQAEPDLAARKNELYADGLRRQGCGAVLLDALSTPEARVAAFGAMDGLVLAGGADIHPERYGEPSDGTRDPEPDRDALEAAAWAAATERGVPVLGICRGLQAINVFLGGRLLQHVDAHVGASYGHGPALTHPLRLVPGTQLATVLDGSSDPAAAKLSVNSYHHQAVRPADLAAGLVASAYADSPVGELVEGFELVGDRFVVAVQCHPERTESTPPAFERLWAAFAEACREQVAVRS